MLTPAEIREKIACNADWLTKGSVEKAKAFIEAANLYLMLSPEEQEDEHNRLQFNMDIVERRMNHAIQWVNKQSAGGSVRFLGVSNLRNQW